LGHLSMFIIGDAPLQSSASSIKHGL